jgi:hypothetical protein
MNDQTTFRRTAAISAMIAAPLQVIYILVSLLAIEFNFDLMADPTQIFTIGERAADLLRYDGILEILGFSLLLVPPALYLRLWLSFRGPDLVNLFTVLGLAGIFLGAATSALRLGPMTEIMHAYAQASGAEREMLGVVSQVFLDVIFLGLDILGISLMGIWFLSFGLMLRAERLGLGLLMVIMGVGDLVVLAGALFRVGSLAAVGQIAFFLQPIWMLWLGIVIWRRGERSDYVQEPAVAG